LQLSKIQNPITFTGIDKKSIFKDDADKDNFLERLKNILTDSATLCG